MTQLEMRVDPLADAVAWRRKNPQTWLWMVECARDDVAQGYRPSVALYVEILRRPHWAARLGLRRSDAQFLIRNALRAGCGHGCCRGQEREQRETDEGQT